MGEEKRQAKRQIKSMRDGYYTPFDAMSSREPEASQTGRRQAVSHLEGMIKTTTKGISAAPINRPVDSKNASKSWMDARFMTLFPSYSYSHGSPGVATVRQAAAEAVHSAEEPCGLVALSN